MATRNNAPGGLFSGGNVGSQPGSSGGRGPQGLSAYEAWREQELSQDPPNTNVSFQDYLDAIRGFTGDVGPQGPAGPTGAVGPRGERGATGPQGIAGQDGADGATGTRGETGPAGPQGPRGAAGPRGAQGARGPQGPAGPQGATGSVGQTGPRGEQGTPGLRGATGATGATGGVGPQGPAGPTGPRGPQGNTGERGATGAAGAVGATGPAGARGPVGNSVHGVTIVERGSATNPTTFGFTQEDENGNISTLPGSVQVFPGPRGLQGDTGAQGPAGPAGATGARGAQGAAGPRGNTGPTGAAGARGEQGPPGAAGPRGPRGSVGPTGARGLTGPAGAVGPAGPTGARGPMGPQGPQGQIGETGPQGPGGSRGPAGPAGLRGLTGPQGQQGPTGLTGPQGARGETGPQGPQGATGARGPQGIAGPTGAVGPQGPAGPTGATGDIGRGLSDIAVSSVDQGQTLSFGFDFTDGTSSVSTVDLPSVEIATEIIQMQDTPVRVTNGRLMRGFNFESDGIYVCLVNGMFSRTTLLDTRLFRRIDDQGAAPPGPTPLNLMLNDAEFIGPAGGTGAPTTPIVGGRLMFNAGGRLAVTYTLAGLDAATSMIQSISTIPTASFNGQPLTPEAATIPANPVGASAVTYVWTLTEAQQTTNNAMITFSPLVLNAGPNAQNVVEVRDDAAPNILITDARNAVITSTTTRLSSLDTDDVDFTTMLTGIDLRDTANTATVLIDNTAQPMITVANNGSFTVPRASLGTTGTRTVTLRITNTNLPTVNSSHMITLFTPFFTYAIPRARAFDQFRQDILDTADLARAATPSDDGFPPGVRQIAPGMDPGSTLAMEIEASLVPRAAYSFRSPFMTGGPFTAATPANPATIMRPAADGTMVTYNRYYIVPSIPPAGVEDLTYTLTMT